MRRLLTIAFAAAPLAALTACGSDIPKDADVMATFCSVSHHDAYTLDSAAIDGDTLSIDVTYSGGAKEHVFYICWAGFYEENDPEVFVEANPPRTHLTVGHDANNDSAEAEITETRTFDIAPIRADYDDSHDNGADRMVVIVDDTLQLQYAW